MSQGSKELEKLWNGFNDFNRKHSVTGNSGSDELDVRYRSPLGFFALALIEHQIAERVKDDAVRITFNRLCHVWMMAHHDACSRIDGGSSEFLLPRVRSAIVFPAGMHRNRHHVRAVQH